MKRKLPQTYYLKTFGCQQNEADSEKIAALLEKKGYRPTKNKQRADLIIINSCSVRESAENRVFGLINNLKKSKIILTGCMVGSALGERKRYTLKQLKKKLPNVELILLDELLKDFKDKPKRKNKKSALVPIMEGCNNFCSYCVVPYARGKEVSRPFEEIVCEVKALVKKGYEEIMLLGQNVNSYGKKLKTKNTKQTPFAKLLKELHKIKNLKKIKFMTSNPWDLTDDIIKTLKLPKIDRYLHLPVQSGDNKILKKMKRKSTVEEYFKLIKKIREEIPNIKIGTDIIVGFPGETKKQFENTIKFCKKVNFTQAYISKYSSRPGTTAFKLKDNIPMKEKKRRWRILEKLIN